MEHEKIIKDQRGTVRIIARLVTFPFGTDRSGNKYRYDIQVSVKPPRKKLEIWDKSSATEPEILETKIELWNLIKP